MSGRRPPDLAERAFRRRRLQDAALVLPLLGVILYMSPARLIFAKDATIVGLPLPFLYIFGSWLILIVVSWRLSRRLMSDHGDS